MNLLHINSPLKLKVGVGGYQSIEIQVHQDNSKMKFLMPTICVLGWE